MIIYTGDTHGEKDKLHHLTYKLNLNKKDTIVVLGDACFNYYGNDMGDLNLKNFVENKCATIFCIHGNHENRPQNIPSYSTKEWNGGLVYYEREFPHILFAIDGEIYNLDGKKSIVIGGAYSVDKYYRLNHGLKWFEDEQPSELIKKKVESVLEKENWKIDRVLSHTCPKKYTPIEAFLPLINQSTVDNSTEEWLDTIEDKLQYKSWFCGHWHIDKSVDKLSFLMNSFIK